MPRAVAGFWSFTEVTDPTAHRAYNAWHQLDHLPEQLPLPGIVAGQRWVCTPACRAARLAADEQLAPIHYATLYLLGEPLHETLAAFAARADQLHADGRWFHARRAHLSGPFDVVDRQVATRVLVSAEAVAHRPTRGVYVVVEPPAAGDRAELAEALLTVPGVAGAWRFSSRRGRPGASTAPTRITVAFCDDDPLTVADGAAALLAPVDGLAYAGPFEAIVPWRWDWFDDG